MKRTSMASSSGTSSGSSTLLPGSGEAAAMDQKKQKRMLSNRESARRSRMRKLQHLEGLRAQVSLLRQENGQILAALNAITNHYLAVEAEHSVLRTQQMELSFRLQSLNEILHFLDGSFSGNYAFEITDGFCNP